MTVSITKRPESSSSCMAGYSSSDSEFESCNPKPSKPRLTNKKQPNRPTSGRPKSGVQQRVRPSPDRLKDDTFMKADSDQIDLDTLLHAVLDINERLRIQESRLEETRNGGRIKRQRPHSAHALKTAKSYIDDPDVDIPGRGSTKVCQRPSSAKVLKPDKPLPHEKKNFSFANDKVDEIDRENQRLLREIMRKQKKEQTRLKPKLEPMRVGHIKPPSEINRSRHQSQIERENLVRNALHQSYIILDTTSEFRATPEHIRCSSYRLCKIHVQQPK